MTACQLSIFEEVDENQVKKIVIKELRKYRSLKVQLENLEERRAAGVVSLYPSVRPVNIDNELKVKQMDRALKGSLNEIERKIIDMKYLSGNYYKDVEIYLELGIKRDRYYEIKKLALGYIATALGII
jgi:ArpU family phage transcriptional regulator